MAEAHAHCCPKMLGRKSSRRRRSRPLQQSANNAEKTYGIEREGLRETDSTGAAGNEGSLIPESVHDSSTHARLNVGGIDAGEIADVLEAFYVGQEEATGFPGVGSCEEPQSFGVLDPQTLDAEALELGDPPIKLFAGKVEKDDSLSLADDPVCDALDHLALSCGRKSLHWQAGRKKGFIKKEAEFVYIIINAP